MLHRFVFMNLQFAGNFLVSILDLNFSSLNGFSEKVFVAEIIEGDTSDPNSTISSYSSVD